MEKKLVSVFLGKNNEKSINWQPESEKNQHLGIVGTSGSGKTATIKSIILELKRQGIPSFVIDFHNEFGDVVDQKINMRELTINPLEVYIGRRPQDVKYEVSDILSKIFGLTDMQEAALRDAIQIAYRSAEIDEKELVKKQINFPKFLELEKILPHLLSDTRTSDLVNYEKRTIRGIMHKLQALFEVDIFFEENTVIPFTDILNKSTAIQLKDFPTEGVKSAIAEFFLTKFIYYLYTHDLTKKLHVYGIVDEAHRLAYDNSPLDRLLRESRKYGAGIILSSQRPSDFSETILANLGGIITLQCNLEKDSKFMQKQLGINYKSIQKLPESGLGYVKFSSSSLAKKIKIKYFKDRLSKKELESLNATKEDNLIEAIQYEKQKTKRLEELEQKLNENQNQIIKLNSQIKNLKFDNYNKTIKIEEYETKFSNMDNPIQKNEAYHETKFIENIQEKNNKIKPHEQEINRLKAYLKENKEKLEQETEKRCPKCNFVKYQSTSTFCINCGARL